MRPLSESLDYVPRVVELEDELGRELRELAREGHRHGLGGSNAVAEEKERGVGLREPVYDRVVAGWCRRRLRPASPGFEGGQFGLDQFHSWSGTSRIDSASLTTPDHAPETRANHASRWNPANQVRHALNGCESLSKVRY